MEGRTYPDWTGDMTPDRLFVYGTLRPNGHAFHLVEPLVLSQEPAALPGYKLVAEGHRYPWCVKSSTGEVAGELLWLRDIDHTLEVLDRYEGIHDPEPEYERLVADVLTGARLIPAWVYVGGSAVPGDATVVEGNEWLR